MKAPNKRNWRAVYTKSRSEKKVAERLEQQGIEVYCPVQTTLKQWSDRKKKVIVPIFPSYVFLNILDSQMEQVLQDPGVLNFVYWLGKHAVIQDQEIEIIREFLNSNSTKSLEVISFRSDQKVEIVAGPFKGQTGTVLKSTQDSGYVVIASLNMLLRVKVSSENVKAVKLT